MSLYEELAYISRVEKANPYIDRTERHISSDTTEEEILATVLLVFPKASYLDLVSRSRATEFVRPRQLAMYFMYNTGNYSLKAVGKLFGGRDHSTVINACTRVENHIRIYKSEKILFNQIKAYLNLMQV